MNVRGAWLLAVALLACTHARVAAQALHGETGQASSPQGTSNLLAPVTIKFHFVSPVEASASTQASAGWEIVISQDGSGTYTGTAVTKGAIVLSVSKTTMLRLEAGAGAVNDHNCETKLKNISQTGSKTIAYALGPSLVSCTFNYSDEEALNGAANAFMAMAETVQAGERLKQKKRFDHLGLDGELDTLLTEAKDGRAIELQNIAPILQSIVEDDDMMGMVRRKAATLLQLAGMSQTVDSKH
jgi:hypothetical protein